VKIETVQEVKATLDGIILIANGNEIFIAWGVVDQMADASEEHYSTNAILDFMSSINNQKPN